MKIVQRALTEATDRRQMVELAHRFASDHLHVIDLPYRFSSWAFDEPQNSRLWLDDAGHVLAWAVMQTPFWTIDYACHPHNARELHPEILSWAAQRARQIKDTPFGHPMWFVNVFDTQTERVRDLEEAGFACQANVGADSWSKVFMRCSTLADIETPPLPDGFTLRPLAGQTELAAYVELHRAAFGSNNMTPAWRARTLQQPEYVADLDLVALDPAGRLAAFCICWLRREAGSAVCGQIEPMGVREDARKLGLGRSLLSEGLRRLYQLGAQQAYVETDSYRNAAFHLYESVGFRVAQQVLVYRKDDAGG
jgi:ribosomal protein S18 acetylase RimI-like enzyme